MCDETLVGIFYVPMDLAIKGFLAMSYLFSITACFMVAKVVRDKHESEKFINKIENAKTEKFLNETSVIGVSDV